jgi:cold shock CspA family protein/ribosome-associated translation inhibitor RaiA
MQVHWVTEGDLDAEQCAVAESRLLALAEGYSDLIDVRVFARASTHHRHGGGEVRITCQARGREIVAARERADVGLALDEVLDVFEREVRKLRERRRDLSRAQPAAPPHLGIVDRVDAGAGFGHILTDAGERVYFHRNAVKNGLDFEGLQEGDRVALNIEGGEKGPQATAVYAPPPDAPAP